MSVPSAKVQRVKSDCQHSLGWSAASGVGALGALAWLRGDQAVVVQDAPDRRGRGHRQSTLGQVPLQGHRAGVEPVGEELFAQRHDRDDDLVADGSGVAGGAS